MAIDISEEQLAMESADLLKILLKDRNAQNNVDIIYDEKCNLPLKA